MPRRPRFQIIFAPETLEHLDIIERKNHRLIRETVNQQLNFSPTQATRNRKQLEQPAPFGATWELRFGPQNCFRVFYEVDSDQSVVQVLAIGIKERNRLIIGNEEFQP
jgi:mRNA-degrading endonuclease RelE of RelBE toxin-antitoxin system